MRCRRLVLVAGACCAAFVSLAAPSRAETEYVTPSSAVVRVAIAEPKALEARSRSWLVSNAIKLCTTMARGIAIILR